MFEQADDREGHRSVQSEVVLSTSSGLVDGSMGDATHVKGSHKVPC